MRQEIGEIQIEDFNYELPDERIAKFPLAERDQSKLLYYLQGKISEKVFSQIPDLLPAGSLLIFNETKVIRARLIFYKPTGAQIEIFCLEPVKPSNDFQIAFQQGSPVLWKCMVGNAKRWKTEDLETDFEVEGSTVRLKARKIEKLTDAWLIEFSWDPETNHFADIIEMNGLVPLPPYLNRDAVESDKTRYQTVYAKYDGSVAAPTAGLHFTGSLLKEIEKKGIESDTVTLHVGAGTFKPVISNTIAEHDMHAEKIVVSRTMLLHLNRKINSPIIPVGTTSMRTLESLFWIALKLLSGNNARF
jgi:S-adenosylmethionine:tRNA ribosyltransferase-isomerase